jgi:trk system potassium uptake protein TrkH
MTCFSAAATCLGNVGPGFDAVGPTTTFHAFSAPIKVILSLTMIAGRLELYSFFLIFTPGFWDSKR